MDKLTIFEILYIIYIFLFFKTKYSIHHPYELYLTHYNDNLLHPINSGLYESKICPFGKKIIWLLIIFLVIRLFYNLPKKYSIYVLFMTFILSLMNMNAVIYLLPYFLIEIYKIYL